MGRTGGSEGFLRRTSPEGPRDAGVALRVAASPSRPRGACYLRPMRTFASPTFTTSTSSKMGISGNEDYATDKSLRMQPYLCVSYDKEEDFYQPMRLVNTVFVGPVLMAAATKVNDGLLKAVTGLSGLFIMVSSGLRYYEALEEMDRYQGELDEKANAPRVVK